MSLLDDLIGKIQYYRNTIADCNEKIERLKEVYNTLGELKRGGSGFNSKKKKLDKISQEKVEWRGEKYNSYKNDVGNLTELCQNYYTALDYAQDNVNNKILELKQKKNEIKLLIGPLQSQIDELKTNVQNALN